MGGEQEILLSIVIPIHRLVPYKDHIQASLASCQNKPCEVILVLDCPDGESRKLVNEIVEKEKQIKISVIEVDAGNPGSARNAGLVRARGEWVTFWDCDDVGNASSVIQEVTQTDDKFDVVVGKAEIMRADRSVTFLDSKVEELLFNPGIWRFVFRRKALEGIQFPALSSGEDQVFLARARFLDQKIKNVDASFYRYHVGQQMQLTRNENRVRDALEASALVMEASFISPHWRKGYSVMSLRLLQSYLRRSNGSMYLRLSRSFDVMRSFRDPTIFLRFFKVWIQGRLRVIR